jgi:hypothetical protein
MDSRRRIRWSAATGLPILQASHTNAQEPELMTAQAISTASLICMPGAPQRAAMIRALSPATGANHATGFLNGMRIARPTDPERTLAGGELQHLPQRDLTIRCISGQIWLTRHGDSEDHILGPGCRHCTVSRDDRARDPGAARPAAFASIPA